MRVAIIHYWLVGMRGGEKVVEELCKIFPNADLFTHVVDPDSVSKVITSRSIKTSFINRLPFSKNKYQMYLPLMPIALEQLDLRGYDLVISSESGPAKGVIVDPCALHLCYCHSPMRYLWDMYQDYLQSSGKFTRLLMRPLAHYLRAWDVSTAARVDVFIANSNFVAKRINKYYRRDATVIPPPIAVENFEISREIDDYYLMVGQLVEYKRADLAVRSFSKMGKKLLVVGEGEQLPELQKIAGTTVKILGYRSFDDVRKYFSRCKALIFPGLEDFGMVPIEAMASGRPVIAYGRGGALDYVKDGETGILFDEQTTESLQNAVVRFEEHGVTYKPEQIRSFASRFSRQSFEEKFLKVVNQSV